MAIATSNVVTINADGPSEWLTLREGPNLVSLTGPAWAALTTIALEQSDDATEATKRPAKLGTDAIVANANDSYVITGPGYIRGVVSLYTASSPFSLTRKSPA